MNRFTKFSILIILSVFLSSSIWAQKKDKPFTKKENFALDLKTYLKVFPEEKKAKLHNKYDSLIITVQADWEAGAFTELEQNRILKISEKYYKKRLKKKDFEPLLRTIYLYKAGTKANYEQWLEMTETIAWDNKINTQIMVKFILQSNKFIKEDLIFSSKRLNWKITENNYKMIFDKDKLELFVTFANTDLICITFKDTVTAIKSTKAKYGMISKKWFGNGGTVTWERNGFPASNVYAKINAYDILMNKAEYRADSVTFKNSEVSSNELLGSLNEKITTFTLKGKHYPVFQSYKTDIVMENVIPNADFVGGISMRGKTLSGSGTQSKPARIDYSKGDKTFLTAYSKDFTISKDEIISKNTKANIFIGEKDYIFHSRVELVLNEDKFVLERGNKGAGKSNFFDSYHKLEIDCQKITWGEPDTSLLFYEEGGKQVLFQSADYFTKSHFAEIQMRDDINPLFEILNFMRYLKARQDIDSILNEGDGDDLRRLGFKSHYWNMDAVPQSKELHRVTKKESKKITHEELTAAGYDRFSTSELSNFIRKNSTAVRQRVIGLSHEGFVEYFEEDSTVKVLPKLYHYTDSRGERKDYDVIQVKSKSTFFSDEYKASGARANATMSLNSLDLKAEGVPQVILSRNKKVGAITYDRSVTIKENRNMEFDGKLRAGMADFHGRGMKFNYDKFEVEMAKADSLEFLIARDSTVYKAGSILEDITGVLSIDDITNRSGTKVDTFANFPIFDCKDPSFVYYDKKSKQDSVYTRDNFFFENKPFTMDSLGMITEETFSLDGHMESGGIFPDFEESLTLQKDGSLGFVHETPSSGFSLFEGKGNIAGVDGKFHSTVSLSNNGLEASGEIKWNTTTIYADDFMFYPDSMNVIAQSIKIDKSKNKKVEYPTVFCDSVKTHWDAENEVIYYDNLHREMSMYDDKTKMSGQLVYTADNLTGAGTFVYKEGRYLSDDYTFGETTFHSTHTKFNIFSPTGTAETFKAFDMESYTDIDNDKAVFVSNETKDSYTKFIKNKYEARPKFFTWEVDKYHIEVDKNLTPKLTGAKSLNKSKLISTFGDSDFFFSETPSPQLYTCIIHDVDSLRLQFFGTTADYDGKKHILTIDDVPFIQVADIQVIPNEGDQIFIEENGAMKKLLKTKVTARDKHTITDVDINIMDKDEYAASSGTYQYSNDKGELQPISFSEIKYNKQTKRSEASGEIKKEDDFMINEHFAFYGPVNLHADHDLLVFKGSTKIFYDCSEDSKPYWLNFQARIDPTDVKIPMQKVMKSPEDTKILADIVMTTDSIHLYTSFISNEKKNGKPLLSLRDSSDYLTYSKLKSKYVISDTAQLRDKVFRGNYLEIDPKNCIIKGEGVLTFDEMSKQNFGNKFKHLKIKAVGTIKQDIHKSESNIESMISLDFFMNKKAMKIFNDRVEANLLVSGVAADRDQFKFGMGEILGADTLATMIQELAINGNKLNRIPEQLIHTLFLSDIKLTWDDMTKSYKSTGRIGLGASGKKFHNRYLDGHLQIVEIPGKYAFRLYIETNTNEWFYFSYYNGVMKVSSSVAEFNSAIEKTKEKDREEDVKYGSFKYTLGTAEQKDNFIQMMTGKVVIPVIIDEGEGDGNGDGEDNGDGENLNDDNLDGEDNGEDNGEDDEDGEGDDEDDNE